MTLITSYATLQSAVIEYLGRDQDATFIARIPSFVQLTEAKINRDLFVRQMEQRSTALLDTTQAEPEFIALPADFQSMRRIRMSSLPSKPRLEFMSGAAMDEFRASIVNTPGQPRYFTIFGSEIELAPTPDANYTVEMVYRQNVPALSDTNTTNWLLTLAPDLYLYGILLETAPYIKDDPRIQVWASAFGSSLDKLNDLGKMSTFNAGPISVRVSGVTP